MGCREAAALQGGWQALPLAGSALRRVETGLSACPPLLGDPGGLIEDPRESLIEVDA